MKNYTHSEMVPLNFDNTRVKLDLAILQRNFEAVRRKAGVPVMAVVKADAYGHGAVQVARLLQESCAFFGVSSIHEALELRQAGIQTNIMVLGHIFPECFDAVVENEIRIPIFSLEAPFSMVSLLFFVDFLLNIP